MKRVVNVFEAFDGKVGTVIVPGQEFNLKGHLVGISSEDEENLDFKVDGKFLSVDEIIGDTSTFEIALEDLVLIKEDGYRGEGCYWALYWDEEGQRMLAVDFVNDGAVYTLME